jgi:ribosomal-protein-alanine N-acetyltransferase
VQVRKARPEDLDAIEAIENTVFDSDRLSRRSLRRYIGAGSVSMLVAHESRAITGYALIGFRRGSIKGRLYSIAVDRERAGRGLGRALLQACEAETRRRECESLLLEVRADNPRAIALYEKAGYQRTGAEPDYYEDGATALRFEKTLAQV